MFDSKRLKRIYQVYIASVSKGTPVIIWVVGRSGVGKSKFAKELASELTKLDSTLNVPVLHLDKFGSSTSGEWIVNYKKAVGSLDPSVDLVVAEGVSDNLDHAFLDLPVITIYLTAEPALYRSIQALKAKDAKDVPENWIADWLERSEWSDSQINSDFSSFRKNVIKSIKGGIDFEHVNRKVGEPISGWESI